MKKQIVFATLLIAMLAPVSYMYAQTQTVKTATNKEIRKANREKQKAELVRQLTKAVLSQNFTFTPFSMNTNLSGTQMISNQYNFMRIQPSLIDVLLPYRSSSVVPNSPVYLDFEAAHYSYSVDTTVPSMLYVNIEISNAMNQAVNNVGLALSMSYKMQVEIFLSSSSAVLTVMPTFYSAVSYSGFVKEN